MLTFIHKIHVIHLYIKYLIWKYFRVSYHLIEDLHVHTNLYDKLQKQHVSDNNKDVQVYFYWCLSGSIFIVYITMNKQKKNSCFRYCFLNTCLHSYRECLFFYKCPCSLYQCVVSTTNFHHWIRLQNLLHVPFWHVYFQ